MNTYPKISVIIYSYNNEQYIDECLESIVCQTLRPWEIIVIENCSADGSWSIIQETSSKIPGVLRIFKTPCTLKQHELAVFALSKVEGDFISWIDGEDRWAPNKLECEWNALKIMTRDPRDAISSMLKKTLVYARQSDRYLMQSRDMKVLSKRFLSSYQNTIPYAETLAEQSLIIRYEDLVQKTVFTLDVIRAFSGLEMAAVPDSRSGYALNANSATQAANPVWLSGKKNAVIDSSSVGIYKNLLSPEEARCIEQECADFMKQFGYIK
jgi:glycosyltransferase involved in cell wall biosynthesis